jgi:SAM-dependent methyltransferase
MSSATPPDHDAMKERLRATWSAGDFGVIARSIRAVNEEIVGRLSIAPGTEILDVACGTGNSAIPAARRGARVVGVDFAPNLLEQARTRAKAAGLDIRFEEGDAEQLAFPDASFDLVISVFGAMFAPHPERVVLEFERVCRPGGTIVMANWTPTSHVAESGRLSARYLPPPADLLAPVLWGDEAIVRERFATGLSRLELTRRMATLAFPFGPAEVMACFREHSGPILRVYAALDDAGRAAFARESEALWREHNLAIDGTVRVESEYLEVVGTRA